MRLVLFVILFVPMLVFAYPSGFIHPLNFDDSEEQKKQVLIYIQNTILHDYCGPQSESCHSSIIVIEREENLKAFYELVLITNKEYLNKIIDEYCNSEFFRCTYSNLLSAYKEILWLNKDLVSIQQNNDYSRYREKLRVK